MELILDKKNILEYQKNRDPYLMIDYATKVVPGKIAEGFKQLSDNEWFFDVHWPGDPNMPGMLQIEALVQMASLSILTLPNNKGKIMYLISADKLIFKKKIVPFSKFEIKTEVISWKRGIGKFKGVGLINSELCCNAEFSLILPDEIKQFNIK
jgi:3-hydroxyacyl-[acyl-carrier-protein] dehydratase